MPNHYEPAPPPPDAPGSPAGTPLDEAVEREPAGHEAGELWPSVPFRGLDALWAGLVGFVLLIIVLIIEGEAATTTFGVLFATGFLGLAAVVWTGIRYGQGAVALAGTRPRPRLGELGIGIVGGFVALMGQVAVLLAVQLFVDLGPSAQEEFAREVLDVAAPWLLIVTFALIAPVAEEIFFRGLLFQGLLRHGRVVAYLVSSFLFGLAHIQPSLLGSAVSIVNATWVGLLFAWLMARYRSLLVPIAAHAFLNGVAITLGLLAEV